MRSGQEETWQNGKAVTAFMRSDGGWWWWNKEENSWKEVKGK